MDFHFKVEYTGNKTNAYLIFKDKKYQKISVDIPESKKLDKDEFYLSSKVDENILEELVNQGFIEKTDNIAKEGDEDVFSYKVV